MPSPVLQSVEPLEANALPLDTVYWRESGGVWSRYPVPLIALQERLGKIEYRGRLDLRYRFEIDTELCKLPLRLVLEHPHQCEISVNGTPLRYQGLPYWKDIRWLPIAMEHCLGAGENFIELSFPHFQYGNLRETENQVARYGTEIEAVYVVGDFSVDGQLCPGTRQREWSDWGLPEVKSHRLHSQGLRLVSRRAMDGSDWPAEGHPFYAGAMRYNYHLNLASPASTDAILELPGCAATVVRVEVNGQSAGPIYAEPYRLTIGHLLHAGENRVELTLYNSLRNLLGPHHHPDGELAWVGPRQYASRDLETDPDPARRVLEWAATGKPPPDWCPDYSLLRFGLGQLRLG